MLCISAHAKINWTLDILGTRADGYHLMDMLMQTVDLCDILHLESADSLTLESAGEAVVTASGSDALASAAVVYDQSNLVYRAAEKLRARCGVTRGARMRLEKHIPSGAGMGGGSADAAAALVGLNELWQLGLSQTELLELGLSLGADVPFLLTGGLAHVSGIGEVIEPLLPAPEVWLVLTQPCAGLSTKEVFAAFDATAPENLLRPRTAQAQSALLRGDLAALGAAMDNVMEPVSLAARPAIAQAKAELEALGAVRAMMTGSGSVIYGVFQSKAQAQSAQTKLAATARLCGWGEVWLTHTQKTVCNQRANRL